MKHYQVTVHRQGVKLTTVDTTAVNSTKAIEHAERVLNLNPQRVQMADNGGVKLVSWNGCEFCAKQI
jgi:hypothetical protein